MIRILKYKSDIKIAKRPVGVLSVSACCFALLRNRVCDNLQLSSRSIVVYGEDNYTKWCVIVVFAGNKKEAAS